MIQVCAIPNNKAHLQVLRNNEVKKRKDQRRIKFKRGQRVFCVNTEGHSGGHVSGIEKSKIYKIANTGICPCGESYLILDEIEDDGRPAYCICGRKSVAGNVFRTSRFRLVHLTISTD